MEERFAVTAATGALGPVLKKLTNLLGDEHELQEGTQQDIVFIKSELDPVHDLLGKLWGREDIDVACKDWMAEARELSYDMEDTIDQFALGLERGDGGFIQQETMVDSPFKDFTEIVKDVSRRCREMQTIAEATIRNRRKLTTDARALFLHKDASELVGMEENKEELIKLLQEHGMVCIVGFAGMGKTTLADLVYNTIGDQFQCRAFVSVHPSPNMMEILSTIRSQVTNGATSAGSVTEPADQENIIEDISLFLSDKRYLVVVDDIWHQGEWGVIRKALPKNDLGCKIVMTTRINILAEKYQTEDGAHVYTPSFAYEDLENLSDMKLNKCADGGICNKIVDMCGAMLLAVICLSAAWAESQVHGDDGEWDTWVTHLLMDRFLSTPSLKPLVQSLCLGFDDLPAHQRTCLLYCSIHPRDHRIERDCLVRKWIAEGFVSQEEAAEANFNSLVSMNLMQQIQRKQQKTTLGNKYTVHPVMLALLVCKAKEDNFVACRHYNSPGSCSHAKQIRRLSLHTDHYLDEDVSHTRSLFVGPQPQLDCIPSNKFKNLKVLEIESKGLENSHLVDICGLIWLRYLGLRYCSKITELPQNIGELNNLETLDISFTHVTELPRDITKLERLENLDASNTMVKEVPKEIRKLQHLKTLDVRNTMVSELSWEASQLPNSLSVIVGYKNDSVVVKLPQIASPDWVTSSSGANCRGGLSIVLFHPFDLTCKPLKAPLLRVGGRHMNVPQWVKRDLRNVSSIDIRLCKLGNDDLEFLKQMPNLQDLALRFEVLPQEPIAITGGGFSKLVTFYFDCRLPRVTFQLEAMPKLKHLEFVFYKGTASQYYSMGIKNLHSLEKVVFRCSEYYTSDSPGISATIDVVRKEAAEHPNEITLNVNDMKPEVFGSGTKWISLADKAIIRKREQLSKAAEKRAKNDRIRGIPSGPWLWLGTMAQGSRR